MAWINLTLKLVYDTRSHFIITEKNRFNLGTMNTKDMSFLSFICFIMLRKLFRKYTDWTPKYSILIQAAYLSVPVSVCWDELPVCVCLFR